MAATLVQYRARFPEHDSVADATVESYLDDANTDVTSTELGDRLTRAQLYYAAHFVESSPSGADGEGSDGASGSVESRTVGAVSVSFGERNKGDASDTAWLESTSYGREYRRLVESSMFGFRSFD